MKTFVLTYRDFLNEARERFSPIGDDKYVKSEYVPWWKKEPQRYRNIEGSRALSVLKFIWEAGEEGRSATEIQKMYFGLGGTGGKRYRIDYGEYDNKERRHKIEFEGEREFDPVKDRGVGTTLLYGSDWDGRPTGILRAHCTKNEKGRWMLTDRKLKSFFEATKFSGMLDQDDFDTLDQLGMFDY
jgi:hypothetical protein